VTALGVWAVIVVGLGCWRLIYAWCLEAYFLFFFQYMRLLLLILAVPLSAELLDFAFEKVN
jgi:hypothetical protein